MSLKNDIKAARRGAKLLEQYGERAESYSIESIISEAEILHRRSSAVSTLKKGDYVVMHTCMEADNPKYAGKIWTCRSDAFRPKGHDYCSIFLEGFSGSFSAEYLQKVDMGVRPIDEWHEDKGDVLWWSFPIEEPPYCGTPLDADWPDYHTHWTPLVIPEQPNV